MFSAQHSPLRCNSRKNGYDITKTSLIASNYKQETAQQPCSFTTHVQQPRVVMGEGGGATSPWPLQMPKGRRQYVLPPPPPTKKALHGPFKVKAAGFLGSEGPKRPTFPNQLTPQYFIPLRCKQRAWYAPSQTKDRPSSTLSGLCQVQHGLTLEKNAHLKPELGPLKLQGGSLTPVTNTLIPHIGLHSAQSCPTRPLQALSCPHRALSIFLSICLFSVCIFPFQNPGPLKNTWQNLPSIRFWTRVPQDPWELAPTRKILRLLQQQLPNANIIHMEESHVQKKVHMTGREQQTW